MPFLDIYFCPKMKTTGLLENTTFLLLYILFNFILKETYTLFSYLKKHILHSTLDTSTGAIAEVPTELLCTLYVVIIDIPEMSDVTRYRSRFYSPCFCYLRKKIYTNVYIFLFFMSFFFFSFLFFSFLFFMSFIFLYFLCLFSFLFFIFMSFFFL